MLFLELTVQFVQQFAVFDDVEILAPVFVFDDLEDEDLRVVLEVSGEGEEGHIIAVVIFEIICFCSRELSKTCSC